LSVCGIRQFWMWAIVARLRFQFMKIDNLCALFAMKLSTKTLWHDSGLQLAAKLDYSPLALPDNRNSDFRRLGVTTGVVAEHSQCTRVRTPAHLHSLEDRLSHRGLRRPGERRCLRLEWPRFGHSASNSWVATTQSCLKNDSVIPYPRV
jgi:hypothetical protein